MLVTEELTGGSGSSSRGAAELLISVSFSFLDCFSFHLPCISCNCLAAISPAKVTPTPIALTTLKVPLSTSNDVLTIFAAVFIASPADRP